MKKFTHIDNEGKARMVDVSEKAATRREAVARGFVSMKPDTVRMILDRNIPKGDVVATARIAGIMAAKKTGDLIPMCHPLNLTSVAVEITVEEVKSRVNIVARAKTVGQTGVEMEALTAVSIAALTIYDMCKAVDKEMSISDIVLVEKRGGKSGKFRRRE
ncbi:MAG: cyclic pyranopterin monophosphate synthase MoaC [Nitrospira bacterium HGW-Nitrospira-1]|nr:MAG: cyclic pyranopterin monophosphate synthase MoaC [Nitrospira bacterium HGW-Nitrospira-1]